jgi:hypothetical protein
MAILSITRYRGTFHIFHKAQSIAACFRIRLVHFVLKEIQSDDPRDSFFAHNHTVITESIVCSLIVEVCGDRMMIEAS